MKDENSRLSKKIEELFEEKTNFEKKIYKIQQSFEDRMSYDREIIQKNNDKLFICDNQLKEKNVTIDLLRVELRNYFTNESLKINKHIFVTDPSKTNVDLNNELNYTRDILAKISKLMNSEKCRSENMQSQINGLNYELNLYRNNNKAYDAIVKNIQLGKIYDLISDSIENIEVLSSEEIDFSIEDEFNLESPSLKFPDKVQMACNIQSKISYKSIPKLDFTKVHAKYKRTTLKVEKKGIKLIDDKKSEYNSVNKKISAQEDEIILKDDYKIKSELKISQKYNDKLKLKVEKYKKLYQETKATLVKFSNSLKIANSKVIILETQVKKLSIIPNTEDTVNKRDRNNTSMVNLCFYIEC